MATYDGALKRYNGSGWDTLLPTPGSHTHNYLSSIDDRDVKPNNLSYNRVQTYFTSLEGLTGASGSDYQDLLVLNTYSDASGGLVNALAFDKSQMKIRYYQASQSATSWGMSKTLAYTEDVLPLTGGTLTGTLTGTTFVGSLTGTASGNLTSSSSLNPARVTQSATYRFVSDTDKGNWNSAYGWGNHASAGYLTSLPSHKLSAHSDVVTTAPTTGQVLKWNGTAWAPATDNNSGTVTSVGMTVPTGLSVTPSSITTSGTFALSLATGYSIPTTSIQTDWNKAALETEEATNANTSNTIVKRDSSGNFSAGTITASLTGTASGNLTSSSTLNAAKLSGVITNGVTATTQATADNTSKIATTAYVKSQGYTANTGTVTSVKMTTPTGLSITGSPITSSGTLALSLTSGYSIPTTSNQTNWGSAYTATNAATNANTASTIIKRDASGNFSAGTITASLVGSASLWGGQSFYTPDTPVNGDMMRFSSTVGWYAHALTLSDIGAAGVTHTHGTITSDGGILSSGQTAIATGDKLVFIDSSDGDKIKRASYSFDGSTTTFLRGDGQFATPTTSAAEQVNISGSSVTGDFNYLTMVKGSSNGQNVYVDSDIRFDGTTNQLKISGYPLLRRNSSSYYTSTMNSRTYSEGYMTTDDGIKIQWGTVSGSASSTAKSVSFSTGYNIGFIYTPSIVITNMKAGTTTTTVISAKITYSNKNGFQFIGSYVTPTAAGYTPTTEEYTWIAIGH